MADAQWILDIAANMPDGTSTIAELDALTASLVNAGKKSDAFQDALKVVTGQLDAAKVAAASANDALAQGSVRYADLEREALRAAKAVEASAAKGLEVEANAKRSAAAVEEYRATLAKVGADNVTEEEAAKLKALELAAARAARAVSRHAAAQPELAAQAKIADDALAAYTGTLKGLEAESAKALAEQKKYELMLERIKKIAGHVDERNARLIQRYSKLAEASALLPGPLGRWIGLAARAGKANAELTATFGAARASQLLFAAGAVIAATALAVLTAAAVAGAAAWSAYVAVTADTARTAGLTREAFAALSPETAAAASAFDDVAAATGLGQDELINLTKALKAAKVAAADMPVALRAAATAEAALGKGGSADFVSRIQAGELAVGSFADEVDAKFGGIVEKKLRGLNALGGKLKKSWAGLFAGVNLEPVLDAFGILVGMFDRANPLAQAMAFGIEKAFGVVADNAVSAAYAVEAFALDVAIGALKAYIFVKENADKIKNALLALGVAVGIAGLAWGVFNAGVIAGWAASAAAAVASAATIAASWLVAAAPALVFIAAIGAVGVAIYQLVTYWDEVVEGVQLIWADLTKWFEELDMAGLGRDLIAGLVSGITGAVGSVVEAVTGAVGSAITAAKDVLGIASPSKVFAEIGDQTAEGYAQGVDRSAPEAQGSMAAMVSPDGARAATSSSGGRGAGIDLSGATFNFYGVADAESAAQRIEEVFTRLLEGDADSLGGAVPA